MSAALPAVEVIEVGAPAVEVIEVPASGVLVGQGLPAPEVIEVGPPHPAQVLDALADVAGVSAAGEGVVLVKDADGVLRPRPHAPMRGVAVAMADAPPDAVAASDRAGDLRFVLDPTAGIVVYRLKEN